MKSLLITIAMTILIIIKIKLKVIESTYCGRRLVDREPLITNGFPSNEGDWPWHAAIYHIAIDQGIWYKCGGTLLNSYSVLTAAHCVYENNSPITPERVTVQLGKYNLKVYGTNTQDFEVFKIMPHPSFNTTDLSNDIGIIHLATQAVFNNYVQPICLSNELNIEEITGKVGTVVGWGITETDHLSYTLRQAFLPVVSSMTCLVSNRNFFGAFLSENNFCAGFRNGTSACNGDSGGGMFFEENGVYYIRGIVSLAKSRMDKQLCNTKEYVIFTHIVPYLPWIESLVSELRHLPSEANATADVKLIACEGSKIVLQCAVPNKTIKIISASYGRTEPGYILCPHPNSIITNCMSYYSKVLVVERCDGKSICELEASNSVFGDPCENTFKYLKVHFNCV